MLPPLCTIVAVACAVDVTERIAPLATVLNELVRGVEAQSCDGMICTVLVFDEVLELHPYPRHRFDGRLDDAGLDRGLRRGRHGRLGGLCLEGRKGEDQNEENR